MLTWIAGGFLALAVADGPKDELVAVATQLAGAESYRFTSLTETERGGRGGGSGEPQPVKGEVAAHRPMHLSVGETEAYKDGDMLVFQDPDGEWQGLDPQSMRGGYGGRGGGDGGGRGAGMRAMFGLMRQSEPAAQFAELAGKIADEVEVTEVAAVEGETPQPAKTVYTGTLTEAGTEAFAGRGFGGRGFGGRGGGGPEMDVTGRYTIEVTGGAITSARIEVTRAGSFGERDFELTTVTTLTFSDLGKVEYSVPDDALALFEI